MPLAVGHSRSLAKELPVSLSTNPAHAGSRGVLQCKLHIRGKHLLRCLHHTCSLLVTSCNYLHGCVGLRSKLSGCCPSYPTDTSSSTSAITKPLTAIAQVSSLLLAPSSKEAGAKGCGPREASTDDLMSAANVLVRSRELLDTLSGKLAAVDAPVRCDVDMPHCCDSLSQGAALLTSCRLTEHMLLGQRCSCCPCHTSQLLAGHQSVGH
jgi:hypothetical protein